MSLCAHLLWPQQPSFGLSLAMADDGDGDDGGGDDAGGDSSGSAGSAEGSGGTGASSGSPGSGADSNAGPGGGGTDFPPVLTLMKPTLQNSGNAVRGEVLGLNLTRTQIRELLNRNFNIIRSQALPSVGVNYTRLKVPAGMSETRAVRLLNREVAPGQFDLNHVYRLTQGQTPSPCTGKHCAAYSMVNWPAEQTERCRITTRIGMVDGAVNPHQAGISSRRLQSKSFHGSDASADTSHGSAVAALLAGRDHPTKGLLPHARLYAADVFVTLKNGQKVASATFIAEGLDWLLSHRVEVINMSLAGPKNDLLRSAIEKALARGVPVVASAGNDGPRATPAYPAAYPDVIAVTALDVRRRLYSRANRGGHITLSAPGVEVYAPTQGTGSFHTGTSFAAPFVTASVAVLKQQGAKTLPELSAALKLRAADLGARGHDPLYGWGLLKAPPKCSASSGG